MKQFNKTSLGKMNAIEWYIFQIKIKVLNKLSLNMCGVLLM